MTITLTNAKIEILKVFCTDILNSKTPKIRIVASLLGIALCKSNGNFNARTHLTETAKSDIRWWKENVNHLYNDIIVPNSDKCTTTDASSYGWGEVMESQSTGGLFFTSEMKEHINVLEMKAIFFGLKALGKDLTKVRVKVLTYTSTAVACINKFDTSRSQKYDSVTKEIWQWASDSSLWLSAAHIAGIKNTEANFESWKHEIHTEWKLNESVFHFICGELGFSPTIDLFAKSENFCLL